LCHLEGTGILFRRINMNLQPEPVGGERQHAPELAAAENAYGRAGFEQ
jgi:hypothetical protein